MTNFEFDHYSEKVHVDGRLVDAFSGTFNDGLWHHVCFIARRRRPWFRITLLAIAAIGFCVLIAGCGSITNTPVADLDHARAYVARDFAFIDETAPQPGPSPGPITRCDICKGTGRSGDGLGPCPCGDNCQCPREAPPRPKPSAPPLPEGTPTPRCSCPLTGKCPCAPETCKCGDACVRHIIVPDVDPNVDPDLFSDDLLDSDPRPTNAASSVLPDSGDASDLQIWGSANTQSGSTPDARSLTRDSILSIGRFPRVLAFGVDELYDHGLNGLRQRGYTCGPGHYGNVQVLPADPGLLREFRITVLPTFLRVERGRVTHRVEGVYNADTLHDLAWGREHKPRQSFSSRPAYQPQFQIMGPLGVYGFGGAACNT